MFTVLAHQEEVPEYAFPDIHTVLESQQVLAQFVQHFVLVIAHVGRDRDAVLQVARVRFDLVVHYYDVLQRAVATQDRQVLHEHFVLKYEQTVVTGQDMVEKLVPFESLQHNIRVFSGSRREQYEFILFPEQRQRFHQIRSEFNVQLHH